MERVMGAKPSTYEEVMLWIAGRPEWAWTGRWWRHGEAIVELADGRCLAVKDLRSKPPAGFAALGCSGQDADGLYYWLGWDLDVSTAEKKHGVVSFPSVRAAECAALGLWEYLDRKAEVRRSRSGSGVHVRYFLPKALEQAAARTLAHGVAEALGLRADRTPLSRQQFWLWTRAAACAESFKGIREPE